MSPVLKVSRRQMLLSGLAVAGIGGVGLVLGVRAGRRRAAQGAPEGAPAGDFAPSVFVALAPSGAITIWLSRTEMGQGVSTGLPMLIAEELDADWSTISLRLAPANPAYGDQRTVAGRSMKSLWEPLRRVGATARVMLIQSASQIFQCPQSECVTKQSTVVHTKSGRVLRYGELVEVAARLPVPSAVPLKAATDYHLLGTSPGRLDVPLKVTGRARFGLDVRVPGMRFAAVARPPTFGAELESVDDTEARKVPGVLSVHRVDAGVGVVATSTWAAFRGRDALKLSWREGDDATLSSSTIDRELAQALATREHVVIAEDRGDADAALRGAGHVLEATYDLPYLAHATMEPMNATARVSGGRCDVWAPTQDPAGAHAAAVQASGASAEDTTVQTTFAGGGFGRRSKTDEVVEAVQLAALQREPVQVVWSREDDLKHGYYRPISRQRLRATLAQDGSVHAWDHRIAAPSWNGRSSEHGNNRQAVLGATELPYAFEHLRVQWSSISVAVPLTIWRSVANSSTVFAVESFIDELAVAAKVDPLEYRLRQLSKDSSPAQLLGLAAERANWGHPAHSDRYHGVALSRGIAQIAELSVNDRGEPRVHRVVCAVDCGFAVNPDGVRAQIAGGVLFGLSAALYGRISIADGCVQQSNFHDYRVVRLHEAPDVEVHILPSQSAPTGAGELATPGIGPAVANALFAATQRRARALPLVATG